jgi:hypothetical protein
MVWSLIGWKSVRKNEKKKVLVKTNLKLRHQTENEDKSDKWLGGTEK